MIKKFFLIGLGILFFISFVSADTTLTDGLQFYYSFDDENVTGTTIYDMLSTSNNGTMTNTVNTTGKIGEAREYDGDDYININNVLNNVSSDTSGTICSWVYSTVPDANPFTFFSFGDTDANEYLSFLIYQNKVTGYNKDNAVTSWVVQNANNTDNTWQHLCLSKPTNGYPAIFVNGVNQSTSFPTKANDVWLSQMTGVDNTYIGLLSQSSGLAQHFRGKIDELAYWNRTLTQDEYDELYNSDTGLQYPFEIPTPPSNESNESVESTGIIKQLTPTDVNAAILTTIVSSNFEVELSSIEAYVAYTLDITSTNSNIAYCQLEINGTSYANATRSNDAGVQGDMFLMTNVINLTQGTYNQELRCLKSGPGKYTTDNIVGIDHILIDQRNNSIPHDNLIIEETVTSGSSYTQIGELNFTITNNTLIGKQYYLVLEWGADYNNNHGSEETLTTYIDVNGTICSSYPRDVETGNTGSVSGDCLLSNVTQGEVYNIKVYGNGTNAVYDLNLVAKEFILDEEEISGGAGALVGLNFSGNTDTLLINITGGNINHALANVFEKQSYSIKTDLDTNVNMYITLNNTVNLRTIDMKRDYIADKVGVLIGQDIFEDVPEDNYTLSVYANCGTVGATCELLGGAGIGYLTDVTTVILNGFYVNASDNWNNATITNFSAVNGVTFQSDENGTLFFFTDQETVNFTITANNYFNYTVINHNVSNNLSVSLNQSIISFYAKEKFSNNTINNFSINTSLYDYNTLSGLIVIPFNATTHNYTFSSNQGYYELNNSINVSFLEVSNITVEAYNSILNITAIDNISSDSINNFSVELTDLLSGSSEIKNTTNGLIQFFVSKERNYSLEISNKENLYTNNSATVYVNLSQQQYNFSLYRFNSLNIYFYDEDNLTLIDNQTVFLDLVSDIFSGNYSTDNGSLSISLLEPTTYNARYYSAGYVERFYDFTVNNNTFQVLDLYLKQNTSTILVTVRDASINPVEGAVVKAQKFIPADNEYITVEIANTDFNGETAMSLSKNDEWYRFIVEVNGEVKLTTNKAYIISDSIILTLPYESQAGEEYFEYYDITGNVVFDNVTNNFTFTFNDPNNLVTTYCLDVKDLTGLIERSCVEGVSGTIKINITPINGTVYTARGEVLKGDFIMLDEEIVSYVKDSLNMGNMGLLIQFMLTLIFIVVTVKIPEFMPFSFGISLMLGKFLSLTQFSWPLLSGIAFAGLILSVWLGRIRLK